VAWTSAKFRDGNPELYKALVAALKEATEIVNKDKMAAGALWIKIQNRNCRSTWSARSSPARRCAGP